MQMLQLARHGNRVTIIHGGTPKGANDKPLGSAIAQLPRFPPYYLRVASFPSTLRSRLADFTQTNLIRFFIATGSKLLRGF